MRNTDGVRSTFEKKKEAGIRQKWAMRHGICHPICYRGLILWLRVRLIGFKTAPEDQGISHAFWNREDCFYDDRQNKFDLKPFYIARRIDFTVRDGYY